MTEKIEQINKSSPKLTSQIRRSLRRLGRWTGVRRGVIRALKGVGGRKTGLPTESVGFIKSKVKIPSVQIKTRSGDTLTLFGGHVMGHFKRS
eukprot:scaffold66971_cov46-Cyclotella_meneghiniana.AAC.1